MLALLALILGIWVWDHYFSKDVGYAPGTELVALVKIERDLRLADAMAADPGWLKWLAGVDEPAEVLKDAHEVLAMLAADESISSQGLEAFASLEAEHVGRSVRQSHGQSGSSLRARAVIARSAVWSLGLVGLVFIPSALRSLKNGFLERPRGYGGAWSLPLGLVVFLVATLAWIGFTTTLNMGIQTLPGLHPAAANFIRFRRAAAAAADRAGLTFQASFPRRAGDGFSSEDRGEGCFGRIFLVDDRRSNSPLGDG